eukprot:3044813-Prymnesium_polylepis.1
MASYTALPKSFFAVVILLARSSISPSSFVRFAALSVASPAALADAFIDASIAADDGARRKRGRPGVRVNQRGARHQINRGDGTRIAPTPLSH